MSFRERNTRDPWSTATSLAASAEGDHWHTAKGTIAADKNWIEEPNQTLDDSPSANLHDIHRLYNLLSPGDTADHTPARKPTFGELEPLSALSPVRAPGRSRDDVYGFHSWLRSSMLEVLGSLQDPKDGIAASQHWRVNINSPDPQWLEPSDSLTAMSQDSDESVSQWSDDEEGNVPSHVFQRSDRFAEAGVGVDIELRDMLNIVAAPHVPWAEREGQGSRVPSRTPSVSRNRSVSVNKTKDAQGEHSPQSSGEFFRTLRDDPLQSVSTSSLQLGAEEVLESRIRVPSSNQDRLTRLRISRVLANRRLHSGTPDSSVGPGTPGSAASNESPDPFRILWATTASRPSSTVPDSAVDIGGRPGTALLEAANELALCLREGSSVCIVLHSRTTL